MSGFVASREQDKMMVQSRGSSHYNLNPSVRSIVDQSTLQDEINGSHDMKRRTKRQKREPAHYGPWPALPFDLFDTIIKRLSLPNVLSIGHVCKEWRWFSWSARQFVLASTAPLVVIKVNPRKRSLYFYNMVNEERYVTKVSSFVGTFVKGSSSGFLIIEKYKAIWFVNPITGVNLEVVKPPGTYGHKTRAIIITKTVPQDEYLVVLHNMYTKTLHVHWLSSGNWTQYSYLEEPWSISDLVVCRGRIFCLLSNFNIGMLILPDTTFKTYEVNGEQKFYYSARLMVSDDHQVMLVEFVRSVNVFRLDFGLKKWIRVEDLGNKALFLDDSVTTKKLCDPRPWGGFTNCFYNLSPCLAKGLCHVMSLNFDVIQDIPIKMGTVHPKSLKPVCCWYFPQFADSVDRVWAGEQGLDPRMACLPDNMTTDEDPWFQHLQALSHPT